MDVKWPVGVHVMERVKGHRSPVVTRALFQQLFELGKLEPQLDFSQGHARSCKVMQGHEESERD